MLRVAAAILVCLLAVGAAAASEVPQRDPALKGAGTLDLYMQALEARAAGRIAAWLHLSGELVARAPTHPDLILNYAQAAAASDERPLALRMLALGLARGGGYGIAAVPEFAAFANDPEFRRLAEQDARNLRPIARATRFASIDDDAFQPEGITYDQNGRRFLMGSGKGEIWQVDLEGRFTPFAQPTDGSLFRVLGLKVDAARNLLWAANGVYPDIPPSPTPKPRTGVSAVNVYDLSTRALKARYVLDELPVQHGFNDLALLKNGDAFVSDSAAHALYRIDAGRGTISHFFSDSDVTFPNGIALSADERVLYVGHIEGVSAIDVATGKRTPLSVADDMAITSFDGLIAVGRSLYGIQPSPSLQRSVRLDLDETGLNVERLTVLNARSHPTLQPATGVIVDGTLYTTGRPKAVGSAAGPAKEPTSILRIPLLERR